MPPRRARPRSQPKQARSRFVVASIVEAAGRVLSRGGLNAATMSRIADVAGVSPGTLYRYFPAREAVLGALIDERLERDVAAFHAALERIERQATTNSVGQTLDRLLGVLMQSDQVTDPHLLLHLVDVLESAGRLPNVRRAIDEMARAFAGHLSRMHPELGSREEVAMRCHMLAWGTRAAFLARVRVEDPLDEARLQAELRRWGLLVLQGHGDQRHEARDGRGDQRQ